MIFYILKPIYYIILLKMNIIKCIHKNHLKKVRHPNCLHIFFTSVYINCLKFLWMNLQVKLFKQFIIV